MMDWPMRRKWIYGIAVLCLLGGSVIAQTGPTLDFMPKGGKSLLMGVIDKPEGAALRTEIDKKRTREEWLQYLAGVKVLADQRETETLAAYLAINLPLPADKSQDIAASLPADGRELAWNGCQSCHSLFTGYLTQSRDAAGWQNMFLAPFHKELRMTPAQREEFIQYSTINMPMKFEDVPEELRF
jgi:hypothetical protein